MQTQNIKLRSLLATKSIFHFCRIIAHKPFSRKIQVPFKKSTQRYCYFMSRDPNKENDSLS